MLGRRFQQQCNHEICTTTLLLITKCWGGQNILCPPLSKSWGDMSPRPPINSVPDSVLNIRSHQNKYFLSVKFCNKETTACNWCRNVGHFFVYFHLRCVANKLKTISQMSTLPTSEKIYVDAIGTVGLLPSENTVCEWRQ